MSALDPEVLKERTIAVEKHLHRVSQKLPYYADDFAPGTDEADVVILHLWHAIQIVVDTALASCLRLHLGTPHSYADAFHRLHEAGHIDHDLAKRLSHAATIKHQIAHAHHNKEAIFKIATSVPVDLITFLTLVSNWG